MGKSTTKDRTKQKRTFDPDGYRRRADAIIFKDRTYGEVLLVSSRSEPESWTVAGGGMEPNESGAATSVREAREEAGVVGEVDTFVGSFADAERKTRTDVYIIVSDRLVEDWEDKLQMGRRRHWFPTDEAIRQTARRPSKQHYLKAACELAHSRKHHHSHHHSHHQTSQPQSSYRPQQMAALLPVFLVLVTVFCLGVYMTW